MLDAEIVLRRGVDAVEAGDFPAARVCFERAASLGDATGMMLLAYMFDVGQGISPDKAEAMRLYRRAWRQRREAAANNIAILYRERGDHRAMFRWFQRAAEAGDGDAHLELAKCYLNGVGVRRSLEMAVRSLATVLSHPLVSEASQEEAGALMDELRPRAVSVL